MAKEPNQTSAPAPAPATEEEWTPPKGDQEFVFKDVASAPAWIDKGWGSFDRGPALAIPMRDYPAEGRPMRDQPYATEMARVGDTVQWKADRRRFFVIHSEEAPTDEQLRDANMVRDGEEGSLKPALEETKTSKEAARKATEEGRKGH